MGTREAKRALLSTIPESILYLTQNFNGVSPFKTKTADQIYADLEESRNFYKCGEYEDFDNALNEISERYGL